MTQHQLTQHNHTTTTIEMSHVNESTIKDVNRHCEMRKLARVEIQSIMQFLPRVELLHLSRCSRTLLADGDTDIAWCTQPNYPLLITPTTSTFLPDAPSRLRDSSIFWRHQPRFSITFENDSPDAVSQLSCQFILSIFESVPRIRGVSFLYALLSTEEWITILQHSSLDELDEFHSGPTLVSFHAIITPFQRIQTLKALSHPDPIANDNLDILIAMPNLHTIRFTDSKTFVDAVNPESKLFTTRLPDSTALVKFQQLTNISIRDFRMSSNEFLTTFTSPQLCQLKELHIQDWELDGRPAFVTGQLTNKTRDDLSQTFTSMKQLSHLSLISVPGINDILPMLLPLTQLKQLHLGYTADGYLSLKPTLPTLRLLLAHHLALVIHLRIYQLRPPLHPLSDYESLSNESNGRFHLTPALTLCGLCENEVCAWSCQECDLQLCYPCDTDLHSPVKLARHPRTKANS